MFNINTSFNIAIGFATDGDTLNCVIHVYYLPYVITENANENALKLVRSWDKLIGLF